MKSFSPWNSTESERLKFLESMPFESSISNQNRLNELDEAIRHFGEEISGALFVVFMLDEISTAIHSRKGEINGEGALTPAFMYDVNSILKRLKEMFLNISCFEVKQIEDQKLEEGRKNLKSIK